MNKLHTLLISALVTLGSCNLDLAPENTMVDQTVYKNANTSEAALLGAYVRLNITVSGGPINQNYYPNAGYPYLFGDLGTDNLKAQSGSVDVLAIEQAQYSDKEHDGFLRNMWIYGYNCIDYANNVISGIKAYGKYDGKLMAQHIAEAKFIRAYAYFQLLEIFGDQALMGNDDGLGLVLRLEPYDGYDPDVKVERSTNAQTWERIITDLKEAIPDLPESVPTTVTERVRATQPVAKALLSRVYLFKGTFTNNKEELKLARDYASEVLGVSAYKFATEQSEYLTNLFPLNLEENKEDKGQPTNRSSEIIFFEASRLEVDKYPSGIYQYYGKRSFYVPDAMKNYYDEGDVRGYNADNSYLLAQGSKTDNKDNITSMKYSNSSSTDYNNDVIYIRLAEVKLTFAEANVRYNNAVTDEDIRHLNDIHQRAFADDKKPEKYTAGQFASADAFLKVLLKERNRELAFEGLHRWDVIRTNNLLNDAHMAAVPKNRWNAPIPDYEVNISEGVIKQNSGY